jgi:hypothetical protein
MHSMSSQTLSCSKVVTLSLQHLGQINSVTEAVLQMTIVVIAHQTWYFILQNYFKVVTMVEQIKEIILIPFDYQS